MNYKLCSKTGPSPTCIRSHEYNIPSYFTSPRYTNRPKSN